MKSTRPSRATDTQDWRRQRQDKETRATKLAQQRRRAEQGKPLDEEGESRE